MNPPDPRSLRGSPYTDIPTGLCYSCRHLAENRHCHGDGDMEPEGHFLGLRCSCHCRVTP